MFADKAVTTVLPVISAEPWPIATAQAVLASIAAALAYRIWTRKLEDGFVQLLGAFLWLGQIFLIGSIAAGLAPTPAVARRLKGSTLYLLSCFNSLQSFSSKLLPVWLVFLLAEMHALIAYGAVRAHRPALHFALQPLATLVLPILVLNCSNRRACPRAGSASEAAPDLGYLEFRTPPPKPGSAAKRAQAPATHYIPVLGDRHKVCVKIATHHHPTALQLGSLNKLARTVERLGWKGSNGHGCHLVLSAAVRHGCILISLDVAVVPYPAGNSQESRGGDATVAWAKQLLPQVLHELGLSDDHHPAMLEPDQYIRIQVNQEVVHATMAPDTLEWHFDVQHVTQQGNSGSTLALASARAITHEGIMAPVSEAAPSPSQGLHTVSFAIVLTHLGQALDMPLAGGSSPADSRLPSLASVKVEDHEQSTSSAGLAASSASTVHDKPELQLWVHSQGQYLTTTVQSTAAASASGGATTIQAQVQLPTCALARHHQPAGPIARLQLLTVELWSGDMVLGSTPLLVDAEQHMRPPIPCTFGWWGVSACPAAGLVDEMTTLATRAAQASDADAQPFMLDLAAWLARMQEAAPGTCCDMCEPSSQTISGISLQQSVALSQNLQQYAEACGLHCTQSVVRRQHAVVLGAWNESDTRGGRPSPGTALPTADGWIWRAFMVLSAWAACVRPCPECDCLYYHRLRAYLHRVWIFASLLRITSRLVIVFQKVPGVSFISSLPAVFHALALISDMLWSGTAAPTPPVPPTSWRARISHWLVHEGGFQLLAWSVKLAVGLAFVLDLISPSPVQCKLLAGGGSVMFIDSMFCLVIEKVHVWGRMPDWLFHYLLLWDAMAYHKKIQDACRPVDAAPSRPSQLALPLFMVMLPLTMNMYWRRLLRPSHTTSATGRLAHFGKGD